MIDIVKQTDKYNRETWRFYWENEYHIWLDEYRLQNRLSNKRKWEDVKIYIRIGDKRNILSDKLLKESDVILSNWIVAKVREWITENTQIKYWGKRV